MKTNPFIFDVKGNCLDDGPGIRTVVFFKGCPLDCLWCHNPESKSARPEISYDCEKCIACGECVNACPEEAISFGRVDGSNPINWEKCSSCFTCVESCPSGALERIGNEMTIDEIVKKILSYKPFYDESGGGMTLSGGEPLLYMEFASGLLRAAREAGIHTLVETSGLFDYDRYLEWIHPHTDLVYMDIKFIDPEKHKRFCGVRNDKILDNFVNLHQLTRNGSFGILPRIPLIPSVTATRENLEAIAAFLAGHGVKEVSLLPNNPLWFVKLNQLGKQPAVPADDPIRQWFDKDHIAGFEKIFLGVGIAVV